MTSNSKRVKDFALASKLYRMMLKIRRAEERIIEIYPSDKIQSPVHLSIGQEAVSVGVCQALTREDHIYGTYRSHGIHIAKEASLERMFAELYAKKTGCAGGKGGSMHLVAPEVGFMGSSAIVASTIPTATGDALASQMQGRKRVVVSLFGDGAVDEGVFFESINFAVLKNLPIIFVIENNYYAIHSTLPARRKQTDLYKIAEGLGLSGKRFGDDVFTVHSTMSAAVKKIKNGHGPMLFEFLTYRWQEHVGIKSDFFQTYRRKAEEKLARKNDPIAKAKSDLKAWFKVKDSVFDKWEAEIKKEIDQAVEFAENSPFPETKRLWNYVFAQ